MGKRHVVSVVLLTGLVHAEPHGSVDTALAKTAAKIKLYCENRSLEVKIDWPAFEGLDFQALLASDNANVAASPELLKRVRKFILTNDEEGKGSGPAMVGTVTGGASTAILAFESICRDQPQLRTAAAKITTIVLEPIADYKYLADHDKIAFARRTNDWTAVHNAFAEEDRDMDWHLHLLLPRFAVSGTTLTVTQSVMGYSGKREELSGALAAALGSKGDEPKKPDAPVERKPPKDPPKNAKRDLGPQLDCNKDYADVHDYSSERDYATGALVFITFAAQPTTLYRCTGRSGCEKGDSLLGPRWTLAGHC